MDIEFLKSLAVEAGDRALILAMRLEPELKADNSYVTEVDRQTELLIRESLNSRYPDFAFLGEEYGFQGCAGAPLWAVDPIDGTTNMVFGIPFWCISIGLLCAGAPIAGVVYLPNTTELFWAESGKGAFCNGKRLQAKDRVTIHSEDTLGFTSSAIKNLEVIGLPGRLRCLGSIAADIVYAASGSLCCLIGWNEGAYDMAAALCISDEAGCERTYLNGQPLDLEVVLRNGKTTDPFVVAPPSMAARIRASVFRRDLPDYVA
ncbi:MAG TPA: inositol monophosphatase family protein [Chthonomonadales bacterium]|nr:inositol monophosphatase family protein [Chthonomonadales bacterium]